MGKHYTIEQIEIIKNGYLNNIPVMDIAKSIGKTSSSVSTKASRLGFKHTYHSLKTQEQFDKDLVEKCPTMQRLEPYKGSNIKILFKCLLCNTEYKCMPKTKLSGYKCIHCANTNNIGYKIPYDLPGITYLVYFKGIDLYKIGITSKSIKERFYGYKYPYEIILERQFNSGLDAMNLEKEWLNNIEHLKVNTGLLKSGNTETFQY